MDEHYENDTGYKYEGCKSSWWKYLLTALLTFLGSFCAFYVVSDWHFKSTMNPIKYMQKMERDMIKQEKQFDKEMRKNFNIPRNMSENSGFINVERMNDAYKINIDLRPFDNNEKNVEVKTEGNSIVINAAGERSNNRKQEIVRYSQTIGFTEDIKTDKITKVRQGSDYIITVPFD